MTVWHWLASVCLGLWMALLVAFLGWTVATGGPPPGVPMHSDTMPWPIRLWLGFGLLGFLSMGAATWADKRRGW